MTNSLQIRESTLEIREYRNRNKYRFFSVFLLSSNRNIAATIRKDTMFPFLEAKRSPPQSYRLVLTSQHCYATLAIVNCNVVIFFADKCSQYIIINIIATIPSSISQQLWHCISDSVFLNITSIIE